jgi:hypothetical protein
MVTHCFNFSFLELDISEGDVDTGVALDDEVSTIWLIILLDDHGIGQ